MMYFLFRFHHKMPGEVYSMLPGNKKISFAFMKHEIEERIEESSPEE